MCRNNTRNFPVYLSLSKTSKKAMFFLLSFMFFLLQNWRTGGQNRFAWRPGKEVILGEEEGSTNNVSTLIKCKKDTC
jgi:hypothetical protein